MPHDYKKRNQSSNRHKQQQTVSSSWVWFVVGVLVGSFLMGLAWLKLGTSESDQHWISAKPAQNPQQAQTTKAQAQQAESATKAPKPRPQQAGAENYVGSELGFFEQLPKSEVKVNEQPLALREPQTTQKPGKTYAVQIASFRHDKDAERLRAELALSGIETQINQVSLRGAPYYRVVAGPFPNQASAQQTEQLLQQRGYQQLLLISAD